MTILFKAGQAVLALLFVMIVQCVIAGSQSQSFVIVKAKCVNPEWVYVVSWMPSGTPIASEKLKTFTTLFDALNSIDVSRNPRVHEGIANMFDPPLFVTVTPLTKKEINEIEAYNQAQEKSRRGQRNQK